MFGKRKDKEIKRLLVMRFSAMGDVAMTVPVLNCLATQHPDLRITVVTRSRFVPMFEWLPANVVVRGVDLGMFEGIGGLTRLFASLSGGSFDAVCDLHDVLRTKYLRNCFRLKGTKVVVVDKGRNDKKALIGNGVNAKELRPMVERYADVFRSLGLDIDFAKMPKMDLSAENFASVRQFAGPKEDGDKWVGIAPFAAHPQKVYPIDRMHSVANMLCDRGYKVFLFGAGKAEVEELATWERESKNGFIRCTCGKLGGLHDEMMLMSKLNAMVTMDSANMHIASMLSVPVLSIWGATHPKAGFCGFGQTPDSMLQRGEMPCRPCSIYGNKPCHMGDFRCMDFTAETVVENVIRIAEA